MIKEVLNKNTIVAFLIGLFIGVGLTMVVSYTHTTMLENAQRAKIQANKTKQQQIFQNHLQTKKKAPINLPWSGAINYFKTERVNKIELSTGLLLKIFITGDVSLTTEQPSKDAYLPYIKNKNIEVIQ